MTYVYIKDKDGNSVFEGDINGYTWWKYRYGPNYKVLSEKRENKIAYIVVERVK